MVRMVRIVTHGAMARFGEVLVRCLRLLLKAKLGGLTPRRITNVLLFNLLIFWFVYLFIPAPG